MASFAKADPKLAAVPAEFMGVEAVHRALALHAIAPRTPSFDEVNTFEITPIDA